MPKNVGSKLLKLQYVSDVLIKSEVIFTIYTYIYIYPKCSDMQDSTMYKCFIGMCTDKVLKLFDNDPAKPKQVGDSSNDSHGEKCAST